MDASLAMTQEISKAQLDHTKNIRIAYQKCAQNRASTFQYTPPLLLPIIRVRAMLAVVCLATQIFRRLRLPIERKRQIAILRHLLETERIFGRIERLEPKRKGRMVRD